MRFILNLYIQTLSVFVAIIGGLITSRLISALISKSEIFHHINLEKSKNTYLSNKRDYHSNIIQQYFMEVFLYNHLNEIIQSVLDDDFDIERTKFYEYEHVSKDFIAQKLNFIVETINNAVIYYNNGEIKYLDEIDGFINSLELDKNSHVLEILEITFKKILKKRNNSPIFSRDALGLLNDSQLPPIYASKEIESSKKEVSQIDLEIEKNTSLINGYYISISSFKNDKWLGISKWIFIIITIFGIIVPIFILTLFSFITFDASITLQLFIFSSSVFLFSILTIVSLPSILSKLISKDDD